MKKTLTIAFTLLCGNFFAQSFADQLPHLKRYKPEEVIDSVYGIHMYDKLIIALSPDSVRYDKNGYSAQDWHMDYYVSGKMLHKGFYIDGQIKVFKNFYENGQTERSFRVIDLKRSELMVYYPDGKVKSEISYFDGNVYKETDYYNNGNIEYQEENEKDMEHLRKRNQYYENGTPQIIFELTDKRKKLFKRTDYFANGKVKEEGELIFHPSAGDYYKEGVWNFYDENGKLTKTQKYVFGKEVD